MVKKNNTESLSGQDFFAQDPAQQSELVAKALQNVDRFNQPMDWACLQGALGASLVTAAAGKFNEALIGEILTAYRSAQSVFDPTKWPEEWLLTERNIGATHLIAIRDALGDSVEHATSAIMTYANALARGQRDRSPSIWECCEEELLVTLQYAVAFQGPTEALLRIARACELALLIVPQNLSAKANAALRAVFDECLANFSPEPVNTVEHLM